MIKKLQGATLNAGPVTFKPMCANLSIKDFDDKEYREEYEREKDNIAKKLKEEREKY